MKEDKPIRYIHISISLQLQQNLPETQSPYPSLSYSLCIHNFHTLYVYTTFILSMYAPLSYSLCIHHFHTLYLCTTSIHFMYAPLSYSLCTVYITFILTMYAPLSYSLFISTYLFNPLLHGRKTPPRPQWQVTID